MRVRNKKPEIIIRRSSLKKKNIDRFLDCGVPPETIEKMFGVSLDEKKIADYSSIAMAREAIISANYFDEELSDGDTGIEVNIKVADNGMITQEVSMRDIVESCEEIDNTKQEKVE